MKLAILLLLALLGLVFGFFLYRTLIRSERFAKLIGGAVEPPPETPDEVIDHLSSAEGRARNRADSCDTAACEARKAAAEIRRRLRRKS